MKSGNTPFVILFSNTQNCFVCVILAEFTTPRAILTGHDCEVTCASVCAELGLVISGCKGELVRLSKMYIYTEQQKDADQKRENHLIRATFLTCCLMFVQRVLV